MMKDGTPDMYEDGQAQWLHFSVLVDANEDAGEAAPKMADTLLGERGVYAVFQLTSDGFGHLSRGPKPLALA